METKRKDDASEAQPELPQLCRFLVEGSPEPMAAIEGHSHVVRYVNPAFLQLLGIENHRLIGRPFTETVPGRLAKSCAALLDRVFATGRPETLAEQDYCRRANARDRSTYWTCLAWPILGRSKGETPMGVMIQVTKTTVTANVRGHSGANGKVLLRSEVDHHELMDEAERITTELRLRDARHSGERNAFEAAVNGASVATSLRFLVRTAMEQYEGGARAAFFVVDADGGCLHPIHGAGAMPASYDRAVDGFEIGPGSPSCGLAAYLGREVIVRDVEEEQLWKPFLHLAREHEIRACWSFPIKTLAGKVVGTFAMYFKEPRDAKLGDLEFAGELTHAAAIIISRDTEARERRRAEARLRVSESRYRTLFNSIDQGFCVIEVLFNDAGNPIDCVFVEINPAFNRQTGITEAVGRRVREILPTLEEYWITTYGQVALTGEPVRFQNHAAVLNRWYDVYAFRVGKPEEHRVAILFDDITEKKRFELELQEAKSAAESANRAKDLFLATLSHEMRTPLTAIVGWMSILRGEECTEEDFQEGLGVIERNIKAQSQLIDDVLDVSRIVSGKLRLDIRPSNLSEIVGAAINVVQPAAESKGVRIEADVDPSFVRLPCDPARMQQVVWNLLSNAVKFTPKGGTIRIRLERNGSNARIQVIDSGAGISSEFLPYVFDRFRQADSSTRRKVGGLGLGLSIAKQLVEMHGGTVGVESEGPGRGSRFTINLPIVAVIDDEADEHETRLLDLAPIRLDGLRVVVVDDEADARRLLTKVLGAAGAIVTAVGTVADALQAVEQEKPHVLLSDIAMPDEDGYDLIRQIRARGRSVQSLPAVALTAYAGKSYAQTALRAGFQVHVPKPVDPHELIAVVGSLAGRTGL